MNYADRLASKIETYGNPSVLGLDPRIEQMPKVVRKLADERAADKTDRIRRSIRIFHELVIDATADIVPAVKLQLAFYEQYGVGGCKDGSDAGVREGVRPCQATRPLPGRKARRLCCWRRGGLHAPHCSRSCARVPSGGAAVGCRLWRTKWSREKRGTLF